MMGTRSLQARRVVGCCLEIMRKFSLVALALLVSFNLAVGYKVLTGSASAESSETEYN